MPRDDGRAGENWLPFRGRWRWLALSVGLAAGGFLLFFGSVETCLLAPDPTPPGDDERLFLACAIGAFVGLLLPVGAVFAYRRSRKVGTCSPPPPPHDPPASGSRPGS